MIGRELLHYQIEAKLGEGGMGEVYRARDTKLGRAVAVKILPEMFAQDPERIARFQREAKLLASLNHSNIAALYGLEQCAGRHFLVMELVDGDTLSVQIARGAMPIDETLKVACQIAQALEAAHAKGVIHRDLKPANVKVTSEGKVKVLDFGLAKALDPEPELASMSNSPTLSRLATNAGVILGTAGYMAPEQAKGRAADQRSDIFSFGCVVYEMLTGRQTFEGETATEVLASILKEEPDLSVIAPKVHPRVVDLLRRCLAKDPQRRWHAVADVRLEIEAILAESQGLRPAELALAQRPPLWKRVIPIAASALLAAGLATAVMWNLRRTPSAPVSRFAFVFPEGQTITRAGRQAVAISPDGQNIVYQANGQLYLRKMSEVESRPIEGTAVDAANPLFSPDGLWIGFYSVGERRLKKVAVSGGAAVAITEVDFPYGAFWGSDDQILLADPGKGILRVSADGGGKPQTIIAAKPGEVMHGPELLPDGDHVLFTIATGPASANRWDRAQVVAQSLKSGERKVIVGGADARYVPTGHLVYALGSTVLAMAFDLTALATRGGPVPIIEDVNRALNASGTAHFAFADNGTMIYVLSTTSSNLSKLVLVDEKGMRQVLPLPAARRREPRISPNGKQAAWVEFDESAKGTIRVYDLHRNTAPRYLTFENSDYPLWTSDSERIIYTSKPETASIAGASLMWQKADGSGTAESVVKPKEGEQQLGAGYVAESIYGKTLAFRARGNGADIFQLSLDGDRTPKPLIALPENQQRAAFSPDGRWIAYDSSELGRNEIFVQPFPPTGAKYQITSNNPAVAALWSQDGRRIFFIEFGGSASSAQLSSVDVETVPSLSFSNPKTIISRLAGVTNSVRSYDVTPDGKFFIMQNETNESDARQTETRITLNWFEDIKSHFRGN
jgi:eukaryotic-like serine/threonine-protein kinase